jgi:precorrin isomerase
VSWATGAHTLIRVITTCTDPGDSSYVECVHALHHKLATIRTNVRRGVRCAIDVVNVADALKNTVTHRLV